MRVRGYSLPFVIMILLMLSVVLASLFFVLTAGAKSTESMLGRRRLFYACDGLSRIASTSAQNYFGQTASPNATDLRTFICTEGGGCTCVADSGCSGLPTFASQTPGLAITDFDVPRIGNRTIAPLDSGPFEGMIALIDNLEIRLGAKKTGTGWTCEVTQEVSLAKIAMFQFFIFSDLPYTDWSPGPPMAGTGRVHANGNICFWGDDGPLYVERVTASGKIESDVADCFAGSDSGNRSGACVQVDSTPFPATLSNTCPAGFVKFTVRDNNDATWATIANRAPTAAQPYGFNKRLQDRAHKVPELKLPIFGTPPIQSGVDARNTVVMSNAGTSRLLVDPVFGDDTAEVKAQKLAQRADIRIIDGVWYLRSETNDVWPGTPIWSDHPGRHTTPTAGFEGYAPGNKAIGQLDIASAQSWGATPKRYSYYRFDVATGALTRTNNEPPSVVSYGVLARDGTGTQTIWRPGYACDGVASATAVRDAEAGGCTAPATGLDTIPKRLLAGTRAGPRNGMAQIALSSSVANYLPINFDVAAFQNALMDNSSGELGTHFPGTANGGSGRKFNGIVWIGSAWPGQMNGRTSGTPSAPPGQGGVGATDGPRQTAFPYPLCSDAGTGSFGGVVTPDGVTIPNCAAYGAAGALRNARPTALRVFNARHLNVETAASAGRPALTFATAHKPLLNGPGRNGLTIATNMTTYLMGDANLSSDPAIPNPMPDPPPHWVPFLVAGDVVHLLSNNWNDGLSRWNETYASDQGTKSRVATDTTYHFEMLSGWSLTANSANQFSGGLHNFPRFQEEWGGIKAKIRGSLVAGWYPVLTRWPWHCCDDRSYKAPDRDWGFDKHLESILNQPPGAPLYDVQATRRWKR